MAMKEKLKRWYTKPRHGFIFDLSNWILSDPKAFNIVMGMAQGMAVAVFGFFTLLSVIYWGVLPRVIFGAGLVLSLHNLYKYVRYKKNQKKLGVDEDISVKDIVYGGKNDGDD